MTITLFVPGILVAPSNASGWSWRERSRWALDCRERTQAAWLMAGRPTWEGLATVTFTGYVRRRFDDDNFPGCVKPIRDMAVSLICGTDDGPNCGHEFRYAQELGHTERGVLITVTPR